MHSRSPTPRPGPQKGPDALGAILKTLVKKEGLTQRALKGKQLAQKILYEQLGPALGPHVQIVSVRAGVVLLETDAAALFQEIEGFRRRDLLKAFQTAGLKVSSLRARLQRPK